MNKVTTLGLVSLLSISNAATSQDLNDLPSFTGPIENPVPDSEECRLYGTPGQLESLLDERVQGEADKIEFDQQSGALLKGNVTLRKNGLYLKTDAARVDAAGEKVVIDGEVQITRSYEIFTGNDAKLDLANGGSSLKDASFKLGQQGIQGGAQTLTEQPDKKLELKNAWYSRCPQPEPFWKLQAQTIELDREQGWGSMDNAVLRISDVPVLWIPTINFPLDDRRKTGLLYPDLTLNLSGGSGKSIDYSQPYYINLAPNYDLTLTPRYIYNRGLLLGGEFRYLGQKQQYQINYSLLPGDNQAVKDGRTEDNRFSLKLDHQATFANWQSDFLYQEVSDRNYFNDLGNSFSNTTDDRLERHWTLTREAESWMARAEWLDYQPLSDNTALWRVEPSLEWSGKLLHASDFRLDLYSQAARYSRQNSVVDSGNRLVINPTLQWQKNSQAWQLDVSLGALHRQYYLKGQQRNSLSQSITTLGGKLFLENNRSDSTINLTPRIYYLNISEKDQSDIPNFDTRLLDFSYDRLFSPWRYSGYDQVAAADRLSLGVEAEWFSDSGRALAEIGIARGYYLDRNLQIDDGLATTPLAAYLNLLPDDPLSLSLSVSARDKIELADLALVWKNQRDRYRLRLRRREDAVLQAGVGFWNKINDRWSAFGGWQYDFDNHLSQETLAGLEYSDCCWSVQVGYRRYLDSSSDLPETWQEGLLLRLQLKGLAGFGDNSQQLLERWMPDFSDQNLTGENP
ncbi:LPS-assembly protein LptD [Pelagibaculum spongiae]|uniref:LPS-assembly protein LptD n=1 Tax=Pelagibaculum spongiae TaxID=2080658 RepID=A0A2V1GYD3_9GAMM|nr:LPS assembly protein LptD [Pelagibaculum spongiae]PVZ67745.1 hypothetical protein DC094_15030 [Pelagibaculum spongiae]